MISKKHFRNLLAFALLLGSSFAVAQETIAPDTTANSQQTAKQVLPGQAVEDSQRIYHAGHSFSIFTIQPLELLAKESGFSDHQTLGYSMIGNSTPMQHWNASEDRNTSKPTLRGGDVDVLILAAHSTIPEEGIDLFGDLLAEHNPHSRLLVYSSWSAWDGNTAPREFANEKRDSVTIEELDGWIESRKTDYLERLRAQLRGINERHDREMAFAIDVGSAVYALRKEVIKGNTPGITKQSQLFVDSMGHAGSIVSALADYCVFAATYRKSPVGLTTMESPPERPGRQGARRRLNVFKPDLTPEENTKLHRLLQQLALEAVVAEPMSGFTAELVKLN